MFFFQELLVLLIVLNFINSNTIESYKCKLILEKMTYNPLQNVLLSEVNYAEVERKLRAITPILFTPENASFYWDIERTFNVEIYVFDGFKYTWIYTILTGPRIEYTSDIQPKSSAYAKSLINFSGYSYNSKENLEEYTFNIRNNNGQILIITIFPFKSVR